MNNIVGLVSDDFSAASKCSLILDSVLPTSLCRRDDPSMTIYFLKDLFLIKTSFECVSWAICLTKVVFPTPGSPESNIPIKIRIQVEFVLPEGVDILIFRRCLWYNIGNTTNSDSSVTKSFNSNPCEILIEWSFWIISISLSSSGTNRKVVAFEQSWKGCLDRGMILDILISVFVIINNLTMTEYNLSTKNENPSEMGVSSTLAIKSYGIYIIDYWEWMNELPLVHFLLKMMDYELILSLSSQDSQ